MHFVSILIVNLLVYYNMRSAGCSLILDFVFSNAFSMFRGEVRYMIDWLRPILFLFVVVCLFAWLHAFLRCMFCGHYTSAFFIVRVFFVANISFFV